MGGRVRRVGSFAVAIATATTLIGSSNVHANTESGASSPPPVRLTIDTSVASNEAATTMHLRIPLAGKLKRLVHHLRSTPAGYSRAYRDALETALGAGDMLDSNQASLLVNSGTDLPELRISDGVATLTEREIGSQLWEKEDDGKALRLTPIDVPPDAHLTVHLDVTGAEVLAANPLPDEDNGAGALRWELRGGSPNEITVRLNRSLTPSESYDPTMSIVYYLIGGLPFALLLGIARYRTPQQRQPSAQLVSLAAAGVALAFSCAGFFAYSDLSLGGYGDLHRLIPLLVPLLGVIAFAAVPRFERWLRVAAAILLSISFSAFMAVRVQPQDGFLADSGPTRLQIGLACFLAALLVTIVLGVIIRWVWEVLPETARGRPTRTPLYWAIAAGVAATVIAIAVQALLAAHHSLVPPGFGHGQRDWLAELESFLEIFPIQLAGLARNIGITMLGVGISIWLWEEAGEREIELTHWRQSALLALLFATSTIGLAGQIKGYAVPLAFLIALVGGGAGIWLLAKSPRGRLATGVSTRAASPRLLRRSVQFAAIKRRKHSVRDRMVAGDIAEGEHDEQLEDLERRRGELFEIEPLTSLDAEDRPREALALGLAGGVGARGRLISVARRGWWIVAAPIAYSAYSVIHLSFGPSLDLPFNPAFVVAGLVDQMLMWPISVWMFLILIPILPGRIGPLKGLVAGAFCALPPGLASLIVENPPGPEQWLFVSAELTLIFIAIGVVLDFRSVRKVGGDLRQLGELYSLTSVRAGLAYLAPLALLMISVIHGLASGSGSAALEELLSNAGSLLPPSH